MDSFYLIERENYLNTYDQRKMHMAAPDTLNNDDTKFFDDEIRNESYSISKNINIDLIKILYELIE